MSLLFPSDRRVCPGLSLLPLEPRRALRLAGASRNQREGYRQFGVRSAIFLPALGDSSRHYGPSVSLGDPEERWTARRTRRGYCRPGTWLCRLIVHPGLNHRRHRHPESIARKDGGERSLNGGFVADLQHGPTQIRGPVPEAGLSS